jgi:hypothetical protein
MFCKEHPSVSNDRLREIYINVKNIKRKSSNLLSTSDPFFFFLPLWSFKCKVKDVALSNSKQVFDFAIETYYLKEKQLLNFFRLVQNTHDNL